MPTTTEAVRVESGLLAGVASSDGAVRAFKGVPYARPPLGPMRWHAPEPPESWSGVRPADRFGPRSVQPDRPRTAIGYFGPEAESEDCLFLNVWTAAGPSDALPVMVWFHGGAFAVGSGALPIFDGAALARKGAVVVTVNYRLGRLGFLAHPQLTREAAYRASGNYGLLDQIAALAWVQRNIAAFGGDPGCITIFGQSAGSSSVNCLMASKLARGLFHRAIGQSGGALGKRALPPLDEAERAGAAFARALGAAGIEALRARPARELQLVRPDLGGRSMDTYDSNDATALDRGTGWANLDGHILAEPVHDTFARGGENDVPLLTGSTQDEGMTLPGIATLGDYAARARAEFGAEADRFLALYPATNDEQALMASREATGDRTFTWENWLWARLQARNGRAKSFYYHFRRAPPRPLLPGGGDLARPLGAFHTADIPYAFNHLGARDWPWQEADRRLAEIMSSYWLNFAKSGDPNGAGLPPWRACDGTMREVMHLGDDVAMGPVPRPDRIAFWNDFDERTK